MLPVNPSRSDKLRNIPEELRLNTADNAELRYSVHLRNDLIAKLRKYFRLHTTVGKLWGNNGIIVEKHTWKNRMIIQGEGYEVAFRECSYDFLNDPDVTVDTTKLLLSVRAAKDLRTKIVLIVPWESYAARFSINSEIPEMEW